MEIELTSSGIANEFIKNFTGDGKGILMGRYIRERLQFNGKSSYRHESNPIFLYWSSTYGIWAVNKSPHENKEISHNYKIFYILFGYLIQPYDLYFYSYRLVTKKVMITILL